MGYTGSENLSLLRKKAKFVKLTNSGINESHVHGVQVTKEAPNYRSN
jgi:IMP dehydrogenase